MGSRSYIQTTQQDLRLVAEGTEGIVAGADSMFALPGGVAVGQGASYSVSSEFTPEVATAVRDIVTSKDQTFENLLGLTKGTIAGMFAQKDQRAADAFSVSQQQGDFEVGKYLPYLAVGVMLLLLLRAKR